MRRLDCRLPVNRSKPGWNRARVALRFRHEADGHPGDRGYPAHAQGRARAHHRAVEQNLDFIRRLSDRVLIIQKGRMTGEIPPDHRGDDELVAEFVGVSAH